ncbi:MAG: PCRF domain-containing protein, partial [Clostridia bacterium]|nr:PCRF domain-containing protein [Clostridia bacterium]
MILRLEQNRPAVKELEGGIAELRESLRIERLAEELSELDAQVASPDFWNDAEKSQSVLKVLKSKKRLYDGFMGLQNSFNSFNELFTMALEEDDEDLVDDLLSELETVKKLYEEQKISVLLSGEYDGNNCILSIHPGAGGTEAQDWAQMLYRMYTRFAERRGFKVKVLDYLDGDEAGIKSVSILIEGDNAYGYLKSEHGVH